MVSNGKNHFENMNVNDMVHFFNKTIKNYFAPHGTTTCDDKDSPQIVKSIRHLIQEENEPYKRFKSSQHFENFQSLRVYQDFPFEALKQRYFSRLSKKLMDPSTSPQSYRSAEAYSEPCQIFKMKRFEKIVNGYAVNYFRKTLHLRCLTRF